MGNKHIDTSLVDKAIIYAVKAHSGVERRGKGFPYVIHPLEAMAIVATMTNDPEVLAATALHDTVEDTDITLAQIEYEFGTRVKELVDNESDKYDPEESERKSWKERKLDALRKIKVASMDSKMVALGDKLSNMRAIAKDYYIHGKEIWNSFREKNPDEHKWRYYQLVDALSDLKEFDAYKEFVYLVHYVFPEN